MVVIAAVQGILCLISYQYKLYNLRYVTYVLIVLSYFLIYPARETTSEMHECVVLPDMFATGLLGVTITTVVHFAMRYFFMFVVQKAK